MRRSLYPHQRFTLPSALTWYLSLPLLYAALAGRGGVVQTIVQPPSTVRT